MTRLLACWDRLQWGDAGRGGRGSGAVGGDEMNAPCVWAQDDEGHWDTACENRFTLNEGCPSDNRMRFCCYCGKALVEHVAEEE